MSTGGQLTSGCAPATVCGPLADEPEKKLAIRPRPEGGGAAASGGGVLGPFGALGAPKKLPPEQPAASSARNGEATITPRRHLLVR
jgi:hypothetical protein